MNKANLPTLVSALCAMLVIVLLVEQREQGKRLEAVMRNQDDFVQTSAEKTAELLNGVQQQTAVLARAIGQAIPVELPASLAGKLAAIETRIGDEKAWPKDSIAADAMLAELRDLLRQIPAWAEEGMLSRLNKVRWGTSALKLLCSAQVTSGESLGDILYAIDTAIEAKPDDASEAVAQKLAEAKPQLTERYDAFRRDRAIADAERLLKDRGSATSFPEVFDRLSEWAATPSIMGSVQKLQRDIRFRVLSDETNQFVESTSVAIVRTQSETSSMVRQIIFGRLLDSVVTQQLDLLENPLVDADLKRQFTELSARVEQEIEAETRAQTEAQETKLALYQSWALSQIQKFNDDIKLAETAVKGTFSGSPDYSRVKDDLVNYLLPISVGFLDTAVARLYHEAFDTGWKLLDGKDQKYLQTEVAKLEAVGKKRKP